MVSRARDRWVQAAGLAVPLQSDSVFTVIVAIRMTLEPKEKVLC